MAAEKHEDIRKIFAACVDHSLRSWRPSNFAIHYGDFYRKDRALFQSFVKDLLSKIKTETQLKVEEEIYSRNIPALLVKLEEAKYNSSDKNAWRSTGVPINDVRGHVVQSKLAAKKALEEELKQAKEKEDALTKIISEDKLKLRKSCDKFNNTVEEQNKMLNEMLRQSEQLHEKANTLNF